MSFQHFYSRVPARVSMYNRADGFDTFAHSEGLDRDFIEHELAFIYEKKLSKEDLALIRKGEMSPVYVQCCTRSGVLVHNCIHFLPLDYTGERSAYLSHSLVFTPEEKELVLSTHEENTFNPQLFTGDIDRFSITATTAAPDPAYPTLAYIPGRAAAEGNFLLRCDPETAKAFLYAILVAICGKGKNIYFRLPCEDAQQSLAATQLFNEVLAILPYQLRSKLSFVSRVNDPAQYANMKLKGVSALFPDHPGSKGVYFDLKINQVVGLSQDDVTANKPLLNFFHAMLENKTLRDAFLTYMANISAAIAGAQNLSMKTLNELVFLFQGCSGLFLEAEVLPNDAKVYEYLVAYEKYRVALSEEYRTRVYHCLLRYPRNHAAIPKNIFSKISKLYPSEIQPAKNVCMHMVLELIHTDIMREKLFVFIRNNYLLEEDNVKKIIISDLSRVYYGGFLQSQILSFFAEHFAEEAPDSQTLILEKLLLSIRTTAVQEAVLSFIDQHYENMTADLRQSFYRTFLEMLPECDPLAKALVGIVNRHIEAEEKAAKDRIAALVTASLEADYRKKEHRMLPVLAGQSGFCEDLVIRLAFGSWQSRKLHEEYLQLLAQLPLPQRITALGRIVKCMPEAAKSLLTQLGALFPPEEETQSLYTWLDAAGQLQDLPAEFAATVNEAVIAPGVCRRVTDVFNLRLRSDGMALLEHYADAVPAVRGCENYRIVSAYHGLIQAAQQSDFAVVATRMADLAQSGLGHQIAEYMARQGPEGLCLKIVQGCLRDGAVQLDALYRAQASGGRDGAVEAMEQILRVCQGLCLDSAAAAVLCGEGSVLQEMVSAFCMDYGKGAVRWLHNHGGEDAFSAAVAEAASAQKSSNSLLSRLFGRRG